MDGRNHCNRREANIIGEKDGPRTLCSGRVAASYQTDGTNDLNITQDQVQIVFGFITQMARVLNLWASSDPNKNPETNPQIRDN